MFKAEEELKLQVYIGLYVKDDFSSTIRTESVRFLHSSVVPPPTGLVQPGLNIRTEDAFRSDHLDHIRRWSGP